MILAVKVVPNSSADRIVGWLGVQLKIKVRAQPEKGQANAAVVRMLAELAGLSESQIEVQNGKTQASKRLRLSGISEAELRARIASLSDD